MASQENHADVVKFLLQNGASQTLPTEVICCQFIFLRLRKNLSVYLQTELFIARL